MFFFNLFLIFNKNFSLNYFQTTPGTWWTAGCAFPLASMRGSGPTSASSSASTPPTTAGSGCGLGPSTTLIWTRWRASGRARVRSTRAFSSAAGWTRSRKKEEEELLGKKEASLFIDRLIKLFQTFLNY